MRAYLYENQARIRWYAAALSNTKMDGFGRRLFKDALNFFGTKTGSSVGEFFPLLKYGGLSKLRVYR